VYEWIGPSVRGLRIDDFRENLAHPAHVDMAAIRGVPVEQSAVLETLPFLHGGMARYPLDDALTVELHLREDDPIYEIWIDSLMSTADAEVVLTVSSPGRTQVMETIRLRAGEPQRLRRELPDPFEGGRLLLRAAPAAEPGAILTIRDLRVLGQSDALREHIQTELCGVKLPALAC
jgi:hypothetical protein